MKKVKKDKVTEIDKLQLEFVYKSYEDGVNTLKAIDLKCQLMMAFVGITFVPLYEYYVQSTNIKFGLLDGLIFLSLSFAITMLLKIIKETFGDRQNLTSKNSLKLFFPKKFDNALSIENYYKEQVNELKKATVDTLIENMIFEKLKFQREFYKKINRFRIAVISVGVYIFLVIINILHSKELLCFKC